MASSFAPCTNFKSLSGVHLDALESSSSNGTYAQKKTSLILFGHGSERVFPTECIDSGKCVAPLISPIEHQSDRFSKLLERKWSYLKKDYNNTVRIPSEVDLKRKEPKPIDSNRTGNRQRRCIFNHRKNISAQTRSVSCSGNQETSQELPVDLTLRIQEMKLNSCAGTSRKRSTSMPLMEASQSCFFDSNLKPEYPLKDDCRIYGVSRHELREFSRPSDSRFQRMYLKEIDEIPHIKSLLDLPELPSPLQRLRKSAGVYPLKSPESILKPKPKQAVRVLFADRDVPEEKLDLSHDLNDNSTESHNSKSYALRFDPRVTVTEYDDQCPREWYSDRELEKFKLSTVLMVKQYFLSHPEALIEYNTPVLDPVTGAMRRKALFCLPILGCSMGRSIPETEMNKTVNLQDYRRTMQYMAESEVQNILVVDQNLLILDLFRRSLLTLFPHAKIETATSGVEALELVNRLLASKQRSYDIIIADERLQVQLQRSPVLSSIACQNNRIGKHRVGGSFNGSILSTPEKDADATLSGSQLFRKILRIEQDVAQTVQSDAISKASSEGSLALSLQPSSLLIGVSCNETDAKSLLDSGADFLWGKPPPCMNNALRNQLVVALVEKRKSLSP